MLRRSAGRPAGQRQGPLRRLFGLLTGAGAPARAPLPGSELLPDIPYGPHPAQCMDVYRSAAGAGAGKPVLVMVHGGGWRIGDKARGAVIDAKVAHWLPRGWIVVSVNYRLLPEAGPREQAEDVALALATVQRRSGEWGGDGTRCVLMGHSSGAHIAALVAVDGALRGSHGAVPPTACVLLDSAALDVVAMMQGQPLRLHRRAFGELPAGWQAASPLHRMSSAPPPTLLLVSQSRDDSRGQAEAFAERARNLGGQADVLPLPLGHAELNRNIGEPGEGTDAIDAFLRRLGLP